MSWPILAMVALGVLAIITSIWAVTSYNRIASLEQEVADLRASANASVFMLEPTDSAPAAIQGQVFLSLTGSGAVIVSNLPQPGDNEEFRLWYLHDDEDTAVSGGRITVNDSGQGFALIPADTTDYSRVAISLEPTDADTPGGGFLLIAEVRPGRG